MDTEHSPSDAPGSGSEFPSGELRGKMMLVVAYDGSAYQGWQVQTSGVGVQQRLDEALGHVFPGVTGALGSSRTDAGVHALGMVVEVEAPERSLRLPMRKVPLAVNAWLPEDIRVVSARRVAMDFNARFDAEAKQYRYLVWNHPVMNPLLRQRAWHVPVPLDMRAMRAGAAKLVGRHDFRSFAVTHSYEVHDTVRTVRRIAIQKRGFEVTISIEGDGFLYRMCRVLAGTLVQVGRGHFEVGDLDAMLAAKDRRVAGMTAPAHGLVLWKVFYPKRTRAKPPGDAKVGVAEVPE